jgi:ubiquinone/menaquinone biosynthesis C-methylase UbiE
MTEKTWVWEEPGDYDHRTTAEAGLHYERYHDLLDLVVVRCRVKSGDRVLDIGTGTGELEEEYFAYLETLPVMFQDAGLSFHAERLSDINSVVWGEKK